MVPEKIIENAKKLQESLKKIDYNRILWRDEKKDLLFKTLNEIKGSIGVACSVQKLDWTTNSEGVNISFPNFPSGIYEKSDNHAKAYVKYGGTITFSQSYNGRIFVIIIYPYVEELVSQKEHIVIAEVDPELINEEFIYEKVNQFLEEMTKWELSSFKRDPLGFKINK